MSADPTTSTLGLDFGTTDSVAAIACGGTSDLVKCDTATFRGKFMRTRMRRYVRMTWTMIVMLVAISAAVAAARLPVGIAKQLPTGYKVLANAHVAAGRPTRSFEIVALGRKDETVRSMSGSAPARPLIVFEHQGNRFVQAGRNDEVVSAADQGGQCDPFLDGDATIATKGRYFTVQNGVACGQHWTDYITFCLDDRVGGFVFDNQRSESWTLNPSNDPHAEALVRDGPARVVRDTAGRVTPLQMWHPSR